MKGKVLPYPAEVKTETFSEKYDGPAARLTKSFQTGDPMGKGCSNSSKGEYNFENFFNDSDDKPERKLRTRNLFYVECSRAKENLVVLALSDINDNAIANDKKWFGDKNVLTIEEFIN